MHSMQYACHPFSCRAEGVTAWDTEYWFLENVHATHARVTRCTCLLASLESCTIALTYPLDARVSAAYPPFQSGGSRCHVADFSWHVQRLRIWSREHPFVAAGARSAKRQRHTHRERPSSPLTVYFAPSAVIVRRSVTPEIFLPGH